MALRQSQWPALRFSMDRLVSKLPNAICEYNRLLFRPKYCFWVIISVCNHGGENKKLSYR